MCEQGLKVHLHRAKAITFSFKLLSSCALLFSLMFVAFSLIFLAYRLTFSLSLPLSVGVNSPLLVVNKKIEGNLLDVIRSSF